MHDHSTCSLSLRPAAAVTVTSHRVTSLRLRRQVRISRLLAAVGEPGDGGDEQPSSAERRDTRVTAAEGTRRTADDNAPFWLADAPGEQRG